MKSIHAHNIGDNELALRAHMAAQVQKNLANLTKAEDILNAIGTKIQDDNELAERMALIDELYNASNSLNDFSVRMAEMITDRVYEYENETIEIPAVPANEALDYFLKVRSLKQSDLQQVATQSTISAIISGKRTMTLEQVKGFAKFFNVPETTFMG